MDIYMNTWFARWAKGQGISVATLRNAVQEMQDGLIDAHLGSGVVKKRVSRQGRGKSGGYRTILATNYGGLWIFMFGFEKNERDNITTRELKVLKELAEYWLSLTTDEFEKALKDKRLKKV